MNDLELQAYRKYYVRGESERIQNQYLNIFKSKSKSKAVRIKCLDCCCFQPSEASDCRVESCPLFNVNPYRVTRLKREAKQARLQNDVSKCDTKEKETENQDNGAGNGK